jgi:hypothetical protein
MSRTTVTERSQADVPKWVILSSQPRLVGSWHCAGFRTSIVQGLGRSLESLRMRPGMAKRAWCVHFDSLEDTAAPVVVVQSSWPYSIGYNVLQPLYLFFKVAVCRPLFFQIACQDIDLSRARRIQLVELLELLIEAPDSRLELLPGRFAIALPRDHAQVGGSSGCEDIGWCFLGGMDQLEDVAVDDLAIPRPGPSGLGPTGLCIETMLLAGGCC